MSDFTFLIADKASFAADLDVFCDAFGYERLTDNDGFSSVVLRAHLRFDFDFYGGAGASYVNVRTTPLPQLNPDAEALALSATIDAQLRGYFAILPTVTIEPPQSLNDAAQSWHVTPNGTAFVDPAPQHPIDLWA